MVASYSGRATSVGSIWITRTFDESNVLTTLSENIRLIERFLISDISFQAYRTFSTQETEGQLSSARPPPMQAAGHPTLQAGAVGRSSHSKFLRRLLLRQAEAQVALKLLQADEGAGLVVDGTQLKAVVGAIGADKSVA